MEERSIGLQKGRKKHRVQLCVITYRVCKIKRMLSVINIPELLRNQIKIRLIKASRYETVICVYKTLNVEQKTRFSIVISKYL